MMIRKGQKNLSEYILEFNLAPMGLERCQIIKCTVWCQTEPLL